jgi:hypothetical protein
MSIAPVVKRILLAPLGAKRIQVTHFAPNGAMSGHGGRRVL